MKRFAIIASMALGLMLVAGVLLWLNLPSIVTLLLGKAIGGRVEARQSTVSWSWGAAAVEINDITLSGDIRGTIKTARLDISLGRGICIKHGSVSDFDVVITKEKRGGRFVPFQIEYGEVLKGRAVYKGQTFVINSITIKNFNTKGQFEFSIDGAVEGFGRIKTHGSGIWRDGRSDISGPYEISDFDLSRLFRQYEGRCDSKGQLTYRAGELGLHGTAGADRFFMRESFLTKPIEVFRVDCTIDIETSKGRIRTNLGRLSFKGTPIDLSFTTVGSRLEILEMNSGPLDVRDIKEYVTLSFVKRLPSVMDAVSDGRVTVRELTYTKPDTFKALLSLEDLEAHFREARFVGITGGLQLGRDAMALDNLKGRWGDSLFSGVFGTVPFSEKQEIRISGRYLLDLADVAHLVRDGDLRLSAGLAEGFAEARGKTEEDLRINGTGRLKDAVLAWKGILFVTAGDYTFDRNGIDCSPFVIKKDGTELRLWGRIGHESTSLKVEGHVDAADVGRFCSFPYPLGGSAEIDGRMEGKKGGFSWRGAVNMDALSFEIPGFMRKRSGVSSRAVFEVKTADGSWSLEDFDYTLDTIVIRATGKMDTKGVANLKMRADAPDLSHLSDLLLTIGHKAKGEFRADLDIYDLQHPLLRLPRVTGDITVKNGYLALPFLPRPIRDVDVKARFAGDHYDLAVANLKVGSSTIEMGRLLVEGTERPWVSLVVRADSLDPEDVMGRRGEPWRIRPVGPESLLSKMRGEVSLKARHVQWDRLVLNDFNGKLNFAEGRASLEDASAGVFGGRGHAQGSADLSGSRPRFRLTGAIDRIAWGELSRALKDDADIVDGSGMIRASLESEGENEREIVEALSGRVAMSSKNGVIRRWNLLSKIFGLLNLYDLLQGKVDLRKEGLPYTVMSADFSGEKGIFKTRNFLIDSPSMYMSGRGSLNLTDGTVEGRMAVSPLVAVDKVLGKVPIIRSILKGKKEGFLFIVYNISGSFRDPDIYSTYVESVGIRAFSILKNLLLLPREVMGQ